MKITDICLGIVITILVCITVLLASPMFIGTTEEKNITLVFNDKNGVFDNCGNFYFASDMTTSTIAIINSRLQEMDTSAQPVTFKVKLYIPNDQIPLPKQYKRPTIRKIILDGVC